VNDFEENLKVRVLERKGEGNGSEAWISHSVFMFD
jgi:hypothetical protein